MSYLIKLASFGVATEGPGLPPIDSHAMLGVNHKCDAALHFILPALFRPIGSIRHETSECTLVKHPFWIEALDHAAGDQAYPKIGDAVSFKLYASQVSTMPTPRWGMLYSI